MTLSEMHPGLAHAIDELIDRAKGCGDTPGDVNSMVQMLVTERIGAAMGCAHVRADYCGDGCKGVKHMHSWPHKIATD